jgi:heat shock protein HslJ
MDIVSRLARPALVLALGLAAGCATAGGSSAPSSLEGSSWRAQEVGGQALGERPQATLTFERAEEGHGLRAAGSGGCNRYFGPVEIEGERMAFGPLAATKRACEPAVMDAEQRFFAALSEAVRFELGRDGVLVLQGEDGVPRARLVEVAP